MSINQNLNVNTQLTVFDYKEAQFFVLQPSLDTKYVQTEYFCNFPAFQHFLWTYLTKTPIILLNPVIGPKHKTK